jgi:hypothetical protein
MSGGTTAFQCTNVQAIVKRPERGRTRLVEMKEAFTLATLESSARARM